MRNPLVKFIKSPVRKIIITSVIISFLVGGLTGGILGGLVANISPVGVVRLLGSALTGNFTTTTPAQIERQELIKRIAIEEESATINVVRSASPAVVSIVITKEVSKFFNKTGPDIFPFDDFFEFGLPFKIEIEVPESEEQEKREVGGGTGFIISEDGLILTGKHVVTDEKAEYSVITNDGKRYDAKVLAKDPFIDIAVLKIDAKNLPVLKLGDSDNIQIGQTVIAIGYALSEYKNTVTKGIVSGIGRRVTAAAGVGGAEVLEEAIQTDAAINPGNSGGPLLNLSGEVVGVNTAINRAGQLVGFAIPINSVKSIIESVKEHGRIIRPWLGVRYTLLNQKIAKENQLPVDYGALILRGEKSNEFAVIPGSPADKAGLQENDIILELNGQRIDENHTLAREIGRRKVGDEIELKILHKGTEKTIKAILQELPTR